MHSAATAAAAAPLVVVASTQKPEALHPRLLRDHVFGEQVALPLPNRAQREEILRALALPREQPPSDADTAAFAEVAFSTEGYTPMDLVVLHQRARHQALLRDASAAADAAPTADDWAAALDGFTPSSLRGVKTATSSVSWRDIGGTYQAARCANLSSVCH